MLFSLKLLLKPKGPVCLHGMIHEGARPPCLGSRSGTAAPSDSEQMFSPLMESLLEVKSQ